MKSRQITAAIGFQDKEDDAKLVGLISFRFVMVTVLLMVSLAFSAGTDLLFSSPELRVMFAITIITYMLSLIYLLAIRYGANFFWHSFVQLTTDVLMWSALVYLSGGIKSPFTFLYALSIIFGGLLQGRSGILYALSLSAISLFIIILMQSSGFLFHMFGQVPTARVPFTISTIYVFILNLSMFGLIGYWIYRFVERIASTETQLDAQTRSYIELERLYANILRNINNGLIITDAHKIIRSWNEAMVKMTGVDSDAAVGLRFDEVMASFKARAQNVRPDHPVEFIIYPPVGGKRVLMVWQSDYRDNRGIDLGTVYLVDNVTHQRKLELEVQRRERLSALGKMSAGIAHEVKNPLAAISGALQLLAQDIGEDAQSLRLLDIMNRETDRLNKLINDFLAYARPPTVQLKQTRLSEFVRDMMPLFAGAFQGSEATLAWRPSDAAEIPVGIDANLFRQIVWNLLVNAKNAAEEGGKKVVITVEMDDELGDGEGVRLVVRDNGPGISDQIKLQMFDPFFTTKATGTGLGMTIAYQLVVAYGGTITVESEPGVQTDVRIHLPAALRGTLPAGGRGAM